MTPEERRRLLGDDAIETSARLAATTTTVTPELLADLAVLLRRPLDPTRGDTEAA